MAEGETTRSRSDRSSRWGGGTQGQKVQPPLTPMIDVTFLLLLYFLLTTTINPEEGKIPGTLPREAGVAAAQEVPLKPIRVTLLPMGPRRQSVQYALSGEGISVQSPEELHGRLLDRRNALGSGEVPVILDPRGAVRWKFVLEAYNQAVRAKYENVGFAPPSQ